MLTNMLPRYRQFIPIIYLAVCVVITVITAVQGNIILAGESFDFVLTSEHYGGIVAVAMATVAFFRFRSFYKYVLVAIFLLGIFKRISFTPMNYWFGIGPEESRLQLELVSLTFGLLVYGTNATKINASILEALKPSSEKARQRELVEIDEFKIKFSRKTVEDLTQIVTAKALVPAALAAAQQLLNERQ